MSEHTRLDEIVEEEFYKPGGPYTMEYGARIAERAFRLGVQKAREFFDEKFSSAYDAAEMLPPPTIQGKCPDECWHGRNSWLHGPPRDHGDRRKK